MPSWQAWVPIYRTHIVRSSSLYGIEPVRIASVIMQESAGDSRAYRFEPGYWRRYLADKKEWASPHAASNVLWQMRVAASYGLMQLMYPTAVWLCDGQQFEPEELFEPGFNIDLGCKLLKLHLDQGKTWAQALAAYNTGRPNEHATVYDDEVQAKERLLRSQGAFQITG